MVKYNYDVGLWQRMSLRQMHQRDLITEESTRRAAQIENAFAEAILYGDSIIHVRGSQVRTDPTVTGTYQSYSLRRHSTSTWDDKSLYWPSIWDDPKIRLNPIVDLDEDDDECI